MFEPVSTNFSVSLREKIFWAQRKLGQLTSAGARRSALETKLARSCSDIRPNFGIGLGKSRKQPKWLNWMVGATGIEPVTPTMSTSNDLEEDLWFRPIWPDFP